MRTLMEGYRGRHSHGEGEPLGAAEAQITGLPVGVETVVVPERGQWAVDIIVVHEDGVIRRRINTYRTEKLAQISAGYIKRGAERDIGGGPVNG